MKRVTITYGEDVLSEGGGVRIAGFQQFRVKFEEPDKPPTAWQRRLMLNSDDAAGMLRAALGMVADGQP